MCINIESIRYKTLKFIENNHIGQGKTHGLYKYSQSTNAPTLYSSCYAAMIKSLYNDMHSIGEEEKKAWVDYLNSFQSEEGLYLDPVIYNQGWYEGDPLWCGRTHLTCHVVSAITCLGGKVFKPISYINQFKNRDFLLEWLEERNWSKEVGYSGNEIMNIGTLLQYSRDFHHDIDAGNAMNLMLEWLAKNHINSETGVWGTLDMTNPLNTSNAVMAAYHFWTLFFYDDYPIPYMERAIDTVLKTQNINGGFGLGVHNQTNPFISSACEDIDSIDPLARMMQKSDYRKDDIKNALMKASDWVLKNQMPDGGFVFMQDYPFEYGHRELFGEKNLGAMFPTWFRTLSLAFIGKALPNHELGKYPWEMARCPGYQFW